MVVWSSLVVPVPALVLSVVLDGPDAVRGAVEDLGPEAFVSTLYTAGLASLVGYAIFNNLLTRYPASSVVPFVLIAPPVAMVSAWALLGEVPNLAESAGGLVVLGGVLLTVWQRSSAQGRTLKFRRNTLSGSHARLTSVSRARVAGGQSAAMSSGVSEPRKPAYDPMP
jgi:O-acetylserine/cysteine efflux transporter